MLSYFYGSNAPEQAQEIELQDFTGHHQNYDDLPNAEQDLSVDDFVLLSNDEIKQAMPEAEDREVLRQLSAELAQKDLTEFKNEDELVNFIVNFAAKHNREISPAGIRKYFKATGLDLNQMLEDAKSGKYTKTEIAMRVGLTIASVVAVHWFAGPMAAVAARSIYGSAYGAVWGVPSAWNPLYWAVYLPGREQFGHLAFNWGPWVCNTVGLPLYHKTVDAVKSVGTGLYNLYSWATTSKSDTAETQQPVVEENRNTIETDFAAIAARRDANSDGDEDELTHLFSNITLNEPMDMQKGLFGDEIISDHSNHEQLDFTPSFKKHVADSPKLKEEQDSVNLKAQYLGERIDISESPLHQHLATKAF